MILKNTYYLSYFLLLFNCYVDLFPRSIHLEMLLKRIEPVVLFAEISLTDKLNYYYIIFDYFKKLVYCNLCTIFTSITFPLKSALKKLFSF